jgi:RND family efflux transporter MFP subunit
MIAPRLLALATLCIATACGSSGSAETSTAEVASVALHPDNLAVAVLQEIATGPSISGTLVAQRQATLRAEVSGVVTETFVEAGQSVKAGQVLLRLDDSAIRDAALSARSNLRTANEALVVARRNAERSERLGQAGALAERDVEQARWTALSAEANLADATARAANAEKQLDRTTIRSPFAGVVSERQVNAGDMLQVGNPAASVVDPGSLRLEATVPVSALRLLNLGTSVDFQVSGYDDISFAGRIERINPALDPATRQVRIYVAIPNMTGRLVAGLFAQGRVATERKSAVAVPISALDFKAAAPSVRRIRGGRVELVAVEVGLRDDVLQLVEILAGLAAGDTVLVGPAAGVAAGTPVRVTKE